MSTIGSRTGSPATCRCTVSSDSLPLSARKNVSQLVPPMSKPRAGGSATIRAATAPPAGPESSIAAGWAAACSSVATPPEESITCGSGSPASRLASRSRPR
jgi:hypothetical protein